VQAKQISKKGGMTKMKKFLNFYSNNQPKIVIFGVVVFMFAGVADYMTWHGVTIVAHAFYQHGVTAVTHPQSVYAAGRSHI
jgi:hypothetical protein